MGSSSNDANDPAEELGYRLRQQEISAQFGAYALKTRDLQDLLQEAVRLCAEGLNCKLCKVLEYLPEEGEFIVRSGVGWRPGVVGVARVGADIESPAGYAFHREEPVITNHIASDSRFRVPRLLAEHGVQRAINVLIRGEGERFGILEVDSPPPGRFTEADTAFLQGFANLLGLAIERQGAEDAVRRHQVALQHALEHQELLTVEAGHRVKNSLSFIAALLSMQRRASSQEELRRALADAEARVQTIAQVHDRLWRMKEYRSIDLAEFLGGITEQLAMSGPAHTVSCDVDPIVISPEKAIALGLVANELVTNAFKYAYPDGAGRVQLSARQAGDLIRFEVKDQGVGFPPMAKSGGLGMRLVTTLGRQLGGKVERMDAMPGTRWVLEFPA